MTNHEKLRTRGLRITAQRLAVLETLDRQPHATVGDVLQEVVAVLPGTSPQCVHNVLTDLTRVGLARRTVPGRSPARYERRVEDNHHHLVCTGCGVITDIDCAIGSAPCLHPADAEDWSVAEAEVTYWGVCPQCRSNVEPGKEPTGTHHT